jgi:hypothetical protein
MAGLIAVFLILICLGVQAAPGALSLVSAADPQALSQSAGGDSWAPIITPDGRFVLFASSANNLVSSGTNNLQMSSIFPGKMNVYLRDRANGSNSLVSINLVGMGGGNWDSIPAGVSTNGRYALFESRASDLVAGDTNNFTDVFVRDMLSGVTMLVSISTNGGLGNFASRGASMTPDGRFVAFVSAANNLVGGDTNGISDIFVRDMLTGTTVLASPGAKGVQFSNASESPEITPDGRFVAFFSTATNLLPGLTNSGEVYVRDLAASTTILASIHARSNLNAILHTSAGVSYNHSISDDGKFVAYEVSPAPGFAGSASGLILRYRMDTATTDVVHTNAAVDTGAPEDVRNLEMTPDGRFIAFVSTNIGSIQLNSSVKVWDAQSGVTTLASGTASNTVPSNTFCDWPAIDPTGRWVSFLSTATTLTTNSLLSNYHIYIHDMWSNTTVLVDTDVNGTGVGVAADAAPQMTADGRWVFFQGLDAQLLPSDRNRRCDLFARDLLSGSVELVSVQNPGLPGLSANAHSSWSVPAVSENGRWVAFASDADNLVANDTNNVRDIFVRDMWVGTNFLCSIATNGFSGDGVSTDPVIGGNGRFVVFTSRADNLVAGDNNGAPDIFLRDLALGSTTLASRNLAGSGPGNGNSFSPAISSDGRFVLFRSGANNLASANPPFSGTNLFVRDTLLAASYALTTNGVITASMTPDGRFVAFVDKVGSSSGNLYVWDSSLLHRVYTNTTSAITLVSISPEGQHIAFWAGSSAATLMGIDRSVASNYVIYNSGVSASSRTGLGFSVTGRWLTYSAPFVGTNQVFLFDFAGQSNQLISREAFFSTPGFASSDSPAISADGRFVVYRSSASNLVPGDTNGVPELLIYDRLYDTNGVFTLSRSNPGAANGSALAPVFSGDGRTVVFPSWASDLVAGDNNLAGDLFAFSFLYAVITPDVFGPTITWPAADGQSYEMQFKTNLLDLTWQSLPATINVTGNRASAQDMSPNGAQRFYRVVIH